MSKKRLYIADFNCTFGNENYPLLKYFEEVIYPAFKSGKVRKPSYKNEYFFYNVKLKKYEEDQFVLSGIIIKKTILERKSLMNDENTYIEYRNDEIPSHPFSYFTIFLNNHTMVLVKNQSGSPTVKDFEATARFVISEKIHELNKEINNKKIEDANINVTDMPCENTIKEVLEKLESISNITLTLYPLNGGDIPTDGFYDLYREILETSGSPEGTISIKKPRFQTNEEKEYISKMISKEAGKVKHCIKGKKISGEIVKIKDNDMSEEIKIDLKDEDSLDKNTSVIIDTVKERAEIKYIGQENKRIYADNLDKLKRLFLNLI